MDKIITLQGFIVSSMPLDVGLVGMQASLAIVPFQ
jgi:hypothetical protein